jgi:CRP-like cAMP-binding protein
MQSATDDLTALERSLSAAVNAAATVQITGTAAVHFVGQLLGGGGTAEDTPTTSGAPHLELDHATIAMLEVAVELAVEAAGAAHAAPLSQFVGNWMLDWREQLTAMLRRVELLTALGEHEIAAAVQALEAQTYAAGDVIYRQDDDGDDRCYFVLAGECCATSEKHSLVEGTRVEHKKHGVGTVTEVTQEPSITRVEFDKGESHRYAPASLHKLKPVAKLPPKLVAAGRFSPQGQTFFGERALSRHEPRAATVSCATDVTVVTLSAATFLKLRKQQERKENLIRGVALFETFGDDQITALASVLQVARRDSTRRDSTRLDAA